MGLGLDVAYAVASAPLLQPWCSIGFFVGSIVGGLSVTPALRSAGVDSGLGGSLWTDRAVRLMRLNIVLIVTDTLLGASVVVAGMIAGSLEAIPMFGELMLVAVLVLAGVVGTYVAGVVCASMAGRTEGRPVNARRLMLWAWLSLPVAYLLWTSAVWAMIVFVVGRDFVG